MRMSYESSLKILVVMKKKIYLKKADGPFLDQKFEFIYHTNNDQIKNSRYWKQKKIRES